MREHAQGSVEARMFRTGQKFSSQESKVDPVWVDLIRLIVCRCRSTLVSERLIARFNAEKVIRSRPSTKNVGKKRKKRK